MAVQQCTAIGPQCNQLAMALNHRCCTVPQPFHRTSPFRTAHSLWQRLQVRQCPLLGFSLAVHSQTAPHDQSKILSKLTSFQQTEAVSSIVICCGEATWRSINHIESMQTGLTKEQKMPADKSLASSSIAFTNCLSNGIPVNSFC